MDTSKLTGYLFFLLSGITGFIFLSSVFIIGEETKYLNRLAAMDKKNNINYFINFKTIPDTQDVFSKYLTKLPNLIYQNPTKGIYFFDIKNRRLEKKLTSFINRFQASGITVEYFSNSKDVLSNWSKKMSKDAPVETHYINSPYLCFLKNCYSNVIGLQLFLNQGVSTKIKAKGKNLKTRNNDA